MAIGLAYFTQVSVDGSYVTDLLPGFLCVGVGLGFSFVPVSIAALAGVTDREAGLASGLINTTQNIGGAVGLAILTTVSISRANHKPPAAPRRPWQTLRLPARVLRGRPPSRSRFSSQPS